MFNVGSIGFECSQGSWLYKRDFAWQQQLATDTMSWQIGMNIPQPKTSNWGQTQVWKGKRPHKSWKLSFFGVSIREMLLGISRSSKGTRRLDYWHRMTSDSWNRYWWVIHPLSSGRRFSHPQQVTPFFEPEPWKLHPDAFAKLLSAPLDIIRCSPTVGRFGCRLYTSVCSERDRLILHEITAKWVCFWRTSLCSFLIQLLGKSHLEGSQRSWKGSPCLWRLHIFLGPLNWSAPWSDGSRPAEQHPRWIEKFWGFRWLQIASE